MKRLLRILIVLGALITLTFPGLYLFVRPNVRPEDGPADSILSVRRPIVGFLRQAGVLSSRMVFFGDLYLPSVVTTRVCQPTAHPLDASEEDVVTQVTTVQREPVYQGFLWPVGDRITYRDEFLDDDRHEVAAVRLWYEEAGRRKVAAEGTVENGLVDPLGRWASVQGYVPRSAAAYGVDVVLPDGTATGNSWGDADARTMK